MILTVAVGGALLWAAYFWFSTALNAGLGSGAAQGQIDILRLALTALTGVGGAVALVVAYRRQGDLERGRFVERFGAAAAQLGSADPAVRLAGVYAMAGVADESAMFVRRQQCIDVLCSYLRLPYTPGEGASGLTETSCAVTYRRPSAGGKQQTESVQTRNHTVRQGDREVRKTIVRVIAARLQAFADCSWSRHDFDFNGVHFEDADFSDSLFRGSNIDFSRAKFNSVTNFDGSIFRGERTDFRGAVFEGGVVSFVGARFLADVTRFVDSRVSGGAVKFSGAVFRSAAASFKDAKFIDAGVDFSLDPPMSCRGEADSVVRLESVWRR